MSAWQRIVHAVAEDFSDLPDVADVTRLVLRLLVAAVIGAALGWKREERGKAAGLRTYMLVAVGAALFVVVPQQAGMSEAAISRIVQGLLAGIGFLGGGSILKLTGEHRVEGLTTAAGIWVTAGLGTAAGLGRETSALLGAALAFVILSGVRRIEPWLDRARKKQEAAEKLWVPPAEEPRET
jgi:putative Mg2+ transporter-C (MgtC) family protein